MRKVVSTAAALSVLWACLLAVSLNILTRTPQAFAAPPYAISLSANPPNAAVGASVLLTATANQDVGPTPYGMSIFDQTSGTELVHGTTGTTLSTSVSQSVDTTHSYVAEICNAGGANPQATSTAVLVSWGLGSAPAVTGLAPASGAASGGTSVLITGSNLTGTTSVRFGSTAAQAFTVNSATSIAATSPAGSGKIDVVVTTPTGSSATGASDQFTYLPASSPPPTTTPQPTPNPQPQPTPPPADPGSPPPSGPQAVAPATPKPTGQTPSAAASSAKGFKGAIQTSSAPTSPPPPTPTGPAHAPPALVPDAKALLVTGAATVPPAGQTQAIGPVQGSAAGVVRIIIAVAVLAVLAAGFWAQRKVFTMDKD